MLPQLAGADGFGLAGQPGGKGVVETRWLRCVPKTIYRATAGEESQGDDRGRGHDGVTPPRILIHRLFTVDHPGCSEAVCQHTETVGPEHFLQGHGDLRAVR